MNILHIFKGLSMFAYLADTNQSELLLKPDTLEQVKVKFSKSCSLVVLGLTTKTLKPM